MAGMGLAKSARRRDGLPSPLHAVLGEDTPDRVLASLQPGEHIEREPIRHVLGLGIQIAKVRALTPQNSDPQNQLVAGGDVKNVRVAGSRGRKADHIGDRWLPGDRLEHVRNCSSAVQREPSPQRRSRVQRAGHVSTVPRHRQ